MKKITRLVSILSALAILVSLAACGGGSATTPPPAGQPAAPASSAPDASSPPTGEVVYNWKVAHVASPDNPYNLGLLYMAELLKERSNGAIQLDVFPSSQLGGERDILEGLQFGSIDMAVVSTAPVANFSDSFYVFDLPYLFSDLDTTYEVLDGEIGASLMSDIEKDGFIGLSYWQNGFFNIITQNPVVHPTDLTNMKIRAFENPIHQSYFKLCGANPIPMAWGEVYTALQNKTVDGCTTSFTFIYNTKLDEVAKHVAVTHQVYAVAPLLMSKITWDSLPADIQELVMECSIEARDYEREICNSTEEDQIKELRDNGMTITEVDMDEWAEFMQPVYDEFVPSLISQELVDSIKAVTYPEG